MNYNIRAQYKKAEYYTVASNKNTTEEAKLLKYKLFSFYFFSIFLFSFQNKTRFIFASILFTKPNNKAKLRIK
jgi:hypothetical protein